MMLVVDGFWPLPPSAMVLTSLDTGFLRLTELSLSPTERHLREDT